jgi:HAE1 family hydrophobic/amphiphilic exporter-1
MIARLAVRHPVSVIMIFLGGMLLGLLALRRLPVDLLPDLDAPRVAVLLRSGDRPPDELEDRYARQLETALATLSKVVSVRTISSTGRVLAIVEYEWNADMDFALLDVQAMAGRLATDRDVDSLVVKRFDPASEPIMVMALEPPEGSDDVDLDRLRRLADERIARSLERVPGVALVQVAGGRRREVRVTIEPHRLESLGLDAERLVSLLQQANAQASGGTVEEAGRVYVIKGLGELTSIDDVRALPVSAGSGDETSRPLRLGDIADVRWEDAPVRGLVTVNGREGVSLSLYKEAGENTVAVSDRARKAVGELAGELGGHRLVVVTDQARYVREAVVEVEKAAVLGGILSIAVLLFFLKSARALLLITLAIPLSVILIFPLFLAFHLSLNVMTLGGIALGTGIVIDNAIVVLEAIFRRIEEGEDPFDAAERGTTEVAAAITAATLTASVVFLPVLFLHGIAAELFRDLALSVVLQLACSLGVALLLVPTLAARLFRKGSVISWGGEGLARPYEKWLRGALRRKALVVAVAVLSVVAAVALAPRLGLDFLPKTDTGELTARLVLPEGSRVSITREAAERLEAAARAAFPGQIAEAHAELGEAVREDLVLSEQVPAENRGVLRLRLVETRTVSTDSVEAVLEQAAAAIPGLKLRLESSDVVLGRIAQSGPPVRVEMRGQDLEALEHATRDAAEALSRRPELFNVRTSFDERRAEVRIVLDRAVAAGLGLTPDAVARQLRRQLGEESATSFREGDEERDVVVRAPEQSLRTLPALALEAPGGRRVTLGELAQLDVSSAPVSIERSRGSRVGAVTAQVASLASLGEAARAVESTLRQVRLPPGVRASVAGAETARRASFAELGMAVLLAITLVYMVLASLFESIVHPFTILLTLPTAGVGVVVALLLTHTPLSIPAFIGLVLLAGIAVNNGILLVDVANAQRAEGVPREEAIVRAGRLRLRAILMTSVTTILGALPLALGGRGSEMQAPLAIAIMGGLTSSTLLTLLVIPVAYDLLDRLRPGAAARSEAAPP